MYRRRAVGAEVNRAAEGLAAVATFSTIAASAAVALGTCTDPDTANDLPAPDQVSAPDPDGGDTGVVKAESYRKVALARAMEEAARDVDPRVRKVGESRYSDVAGRVEIRSTAGLSRGAAFARVYGVIDVMAEDAGESQSGYAHDFSLKFSGLDPFKIGREAARRALSKLHHTHCNTSMH